MKDLFNSWKKENVFLSLKLLQEEIFSLTFFLCV